MAARRYFAVFARPNGLGEARLGIVAGRKAAPLAVDRNRVRRLVREAFRALRPRLAGLDVVVRLRRCPQRGLNAVVRRELDELLAGVAALAARQQSAARE